MSDHKHPTTRHVDSERGVAIVIVLAVVVLLTTIVVAFLSRVLLDRQISDSSAKSAKAEIIANGALDQVIADLRQEIAAGSSYDFDPSSNGTFNKLTLYLPQPGSATGPSTIAPALVPAAPALPANPVNVLKRSMSGQPFFAGGNYVNASQFPPSNVASAVNTSADRAPDGRFISAARWNMPLLLSASQLGDAAQSTAVYNNYFAAPDWVLVTRSGPKAFGSFQNTIKQGSDLTNTDYVVGRYAYMIYDEGGLLDINHAGYPDSLKNDADFYGRCGKLGQVDLKKFLEPFTSITDPYSLVGSFRNLQTASSADSYKKYVLNNVPSNPGFVRVVSGDQTFLSRKDLLNYQKANPSLLAADSLQYLATFTREKNAPVYTPSSTRPKVLSGAVVYVNPAHQTSADHVLRGVSTDPGNPYTYGKDNDTNPSLLTIRNSTGAPVVTRRFPLSRLAMLTPTGPASNVSNADIQKYFGLQWDPAKEWWVYTSPDGNTPVDVIKYLKNVPSTRQPDFFEMLQAAICVGSLGRDSDGEQYSSQSYEPGISSSARIEAQNAYYHVIQIGANIIDQADTDSYPTVIQFGGETIEGIEDLPYIARVLDYIRLDPSDPTAVLADYVFELWNPHQDFALTNAAPTAFQVVGLSGSARLKVNTIYADPVDVATATPVGFSVINHSDFRTPTPMGTGIRVGRWKPTATGQSNQPAFIYGNPFSTFALQYKGPNGNWREYQKLRRLMYQIKESFASGPNTNYAEWFHQRVDPRTDRFGTSMNYMNYPGGDGNFHLGAPLGSTIRSDTSNGFYLGENTPFAGGIFTFNGVTTFNNSTNANKYSTMGMLAENTNAAGSVLYYKDTDGSIRPADGGNRNGLDGQPMATGNFASRPVILNRPFRSVGELGYVFRDAPFKSLDFTNANSGDLALLDAFCIEDSDVLAGRVNLNSRQVPVLTALLRHASKQEGTPTNGLSDTEAQSIAAALVARITDPTKGPLLDQTELVTKFSPDMLAGSQNLYSNSSDKAIKTQRETALRALAGNTNARTWNLMIDVIAQAGRYLPNASKLPDFSVEAERRLWLHVAIDRYTGEIVEQQLEPVNE